MARSTNTLLLTIGVLATVMGISYAQDGLNESGINITALEVDANDPASVDANYGTTWTRTGNGSINMDLYKEWAFNKWNQIEKEVSNVCTLNGIGNECQEYYLNIRKDLGDFVNNIGVSIKYIDGYLLKVRALKRNRPPPNGYESTPVPEVPSSIAPLPSSSVGPSSSLSPSSPIVPSSSVGPSSVGPSSVGPSSVGPSSVGPSSVGPSSVGPSSVGPSSDLPSSLAPPSSVDPSVVSPSSLAQTSDLIPEPFSPSYPGENPPFIPNETAPIEDSTPLIYY